MLISHTPLLLYKFCLIAKKIMENIFSGLDLVLSVRVLSVEWEG